MITVFQGDKIPSGFHKAWLQEIVNMNTLNLNKNTIGLSTNEIKRIAKELLEKSIFL